MTDLGHGRGWLNPEPAESIFRIDAQIGHPLQITDAGRTWDQQMEDYRAYLAGTGAYALHPDTPSVHQLGEAADTDEGQDILPVMEEHGWVRTALAREEWWHFEYLRARDRHYGEQAYTLPAPPVPVVVPRLVIPAGALRRQRMRGAARG
ncbi:hypothetical protein J2Y69_003056 [Microbacterium resistens]|uniref:D-alanyl-D-alanine dipeptidase n=1 Tax=Microbacterium resistens TaxID=156977 RepID=A0ABU1SFR1_9MICO|nr:hypothetical protein [Microbacterium resistens]MDR6868440.1 hypothetical protein [Microbacterium resistens]